MLACPMAFKWYWLRCHPSQVMLAQESWLRPHFGLPEWLNATQFEGGKMLNQSLVFIESSVICCCFKLQEFYEKLLWKKFHKQAFLFKLCLNSCRQCAFWINVTSSVHTKIFKLASLTKMLIAVTYFASTMATYLICGSWSWCSVLSTELSAKVLWFSGIFVALVVNRAWTDLQIWL